MKRRTRLFTWGLVLASLGTWEASQAAAQPSLGQPTYRPPQQSNGPAMMPPANLPQRMLTQPAQEMPVVQQPVITNQNTNAPEGSSAIRPAEYAENANPNGDTPTGRQEPGVSIEWVGPPTAKVGQPVSYQIIVKNISITPLSAVNVKCPIPATVKVTATEPKAMSEDGGLVWNLGQLEPRQEKRLDLQMVPSVTGPIVCQAAVSITGTSTNRLLVHEPKLAVKATGPERVIVGDPATVTLTVTNPGDATAEQVKVVATLSDGLEHARGKSVEFDLGNLGPKETRNVHVLCGAKAEGTQRVEAVVTGEPKLMAQEMATMEVLMPKIDLSITGPGMRYLGRHANLTFKVSNPGSAMVSHVTLVDQVPQGFTFAGATGEGRHDFVSRTVTWYIGDLPAGQSREVNLDLVAANTGEHKNKAMVTGARGLKSEGEVTTRVEGLPALLMELVDLDDPVEVGTETSYEIRVTNTGTKTETNLQLTCSIPEKMEYRGAKGPPGVTFKQEGKEIVFDPLPKLAPRADVIYRVNVCGVASGDVRFRARIKADDLTEPVLKEESTKVYGDEVQQTPHQP